MPANRSAKDIFGCEGSKQRISLHGGKQLSVESLAINIFLAIIDQQRFYEM